MSGGASGRSMGRLTSRPTADKLMRNATLTLVRARKPTLLMRSEASWCAVVSGAPLPTAFPDGCGRAGTTIVGGPGTAIVTVGPASDSSSARQERSSLAGLGLAAALAAAVMLGTFARL